MMNIASLLEDIEYLQDKPAVRVLLNTPAVKEIRIALKKDQEMKAHKATYPIVVSVVEGCIDFGVGEQRHLLEKGMLVALDANVSHDLVAKRDSIVRLSLNKYGDLARIARSNPQ
ncbi:cupin [Pedobacter sp. JY14-1]|uniref:cupin n=1 Tax=Pedobacter sp. JY14-1 TaxID=3034151 RepID=UPI0023E294CE|nr:cupin [Pedobacter sp. JY14-1]